MVNIDQIELAMKASRADNFYYGPDFCPSHRHGFFTMNLKNSRKRPLGDRVDTCKEGINEHSNRGQNITHPIRSRPDETLELGVKKLHRIRITNSPNKQPILSSTTRPLSRDTHKQSDGKPFTDPFEGRYGIIMTREVKNTNYHTAKFELAFHIRCNSCETRMSKGVRFNARKSKIGFYFTTPIFSFTFLCLRCHDPLTICTDPKNSEYKCVALCRPCYSSDVSSSDRPPDHILSKDLSNDPILRLDVTAVTKRRDNCFQNWSKNYELVKAVGYDDYSDNRMLRKLFQAETRLLSNDGTLNEEEMATSMKDLVFSVDGFKPPCGNFSLPLLFPESEHRDIVTREKMVHETSKLSDQLLANSSNTNHTEVDSCVHTIQNLVGLVTENDRSDSGRISLVAKREHRLPRKIIRLIKSGNIRIKGLTISIEEDDPVFEID